MMMKKERGNFGKMDLYSPFFLVLVLYQIKALKRERVRRVTSNSLYFNALKYKNDVYNILITKD